MGPAVLQAEQAQQVLQTFPVDPAPVHQDRQGDVLHHVQGGDEIVELVDQPDLPPAEDRQFFVVLGVDVLPVQIDLAAGGHVHAADDVEQRGFARAGGADDGGELPLFNGQRNVIKRNDAVHVLSVDLAQVFDP